MPKHVDPGPFGADDAAQRLRAMQRQTYMRRFSLQIETVTVTVEKRSPRKTRNGKARSKAGTRTKNPA